MDLKKNNKKQQKVLDTALCTDINDDQVCVCSRYCSSDQHIRGDVGGVAGAFRRSQVFMTTADVIGPRPSEQNTSVH